MSSNMIGEYDDFLLIAQGPHENVYCNSRRHITTEGGTSMPLKLLADTRFKKKAIKCDCPEHELKEYAGFIGTFPSDPKNPRSK